MAKEVTTMTLRGFMDFVKLRDALDMAISRGKYQTHDFVIKEFSFQNGDITHLTELVPQKEKTDEARFNDLLDSIGETNSEIEALE